MTEIFMFLAFAGFSLFLYILNRRQYHVYTTNTIKSLMNLTEAINNLLQYAKESEEIMVQYHELNCFSNKLVLTTLQFTLFSIKDHLIETEQYETIRDIDRLIAEVQQAIVINASDDHENEYSN